MGFFEKKSIDLLTKKDIKTFLLHLIQHEKVSTSTQNQYINAIKFYYEKVLKQPKVDITIERPRKQNRLPKIISEQEVLQLLRVTQNLKHKTLKVYYPAKKEYLEKRKKDIEKRKAPLFEIKEE
jgi:integrase/recombinase XerD